MKQITILFTFLLFSCLSFAQTVHYIDAGATGADNGTSWSDAFTDIQTAIDAAGAGDQLWIKTGLYIPNGADTLSARYAINKPLSLFGGFVGTESNLEDRPDDNSNPTVLSGDILGDDVPSNNTINRTDNSRHIIFVDSLMTEAVLLDGFTLSGGNTSTSADLDAYFTNGGAIIAYSPLNLSNNIFSNNFASAGAGVSLMGQGAAGSEINTCTFVSNTATSQSAGIMIRNSSNISIAACVFSDNETSRGAVYPLRSDNISISDCLFSNNSNASGFGGAFFSWNNTNLSLSSCVFENNSSVNAGVAYIDGRELAPNEPGNLTIENCTFSNNGTIDGFGGALFFFQTSYLMTDCDFTNNTAIGGSAGAIYNGGDNKSFSISNTEFSGNSGAFGGAIATYGANSVGIIDVCDFNINSANTSGGAVITGFTSDVSFSNCFFDGNSANFGAASFSQNDTTAVSFENCIWQSNSAENSGGALSSSGGIEISFIRNDFIGNISNGTAGVLNIFEAGGAESLDIGSLEIDQCSFLGNIAATQGGAVNISNVDTDIRSSYFFQNGAQDVGTGGAISINAFDTTSIEVSIINSTLTLNSGTLAGGIAQWTNESGETTLNLQNTILDNPGFPSYAIEDGTPVISSKGGNFITDESLNADLVVEDFEVPGGDPLYTDIFGFDLSLQLESPCVDAGVEAGAPATDFNGDGRVDQVDIGAFENQKTTNVKDLIDASRSMMVYPNPVSDAAAISIDNNYRGAIKLALYDLKGTLLWEKDMVKNNEILEESINMETLESGFYMLRAFTNEMILVKPIIKQ